MRTLTLVVVLALTLGMIGPVEAVDNARTWLGWSAAERSAYFMGAVDATSDWVGLTCPPSASYAVGILFATEFAERNPDRSLMAAVGYGLAKAGCVTRKTTVDKQRF